MPARSEICFSFTVFLISAGLVLLIDLAILLILVGLLLLVDVSLVRSEEYLLKDLNGEGDRSIDLQACWSAFFYVLPDNHIVYVKARGVPKQGSFTPIIVVQDFIFKVYN